MSGNELWTRQRRGHAPGCHPSHRSDHHSSSITCPAIPLEWLASKEFSALSDAAEAFVLILGHPSAAMAYGMKFGARRRSAHPPPTLKGMAPGGPRPLSGPQYRDDHGVARHLRLLSRVQHQTPALMEKINIAPVIDDTTGALLGIATLGHQLGYNNILPMLRGRAADAAGAAH